MSIPAANTASQGKLAERRAAVRDIAYYEAELRRVPHCTRIPALLEHERGHLERVEEFLRLAGWRQP